MDCVVDERKKPSTANKDFTHLLKIFSTWRDLKLEQLANLFLPLRLAQNDLQDHRPLFTRDWLKTVLLAPDAFGATNEETALVFKILINTGPRPSELLGTKLEHFVLEHEVPHIRVEEYSDGVIKRKLKTKWSEREIPLVGVSLDAAKRIVTMGGVQAYHLKADRWGALINKVMVERKLKETERHTPYSL
ncbi:hypothetical protein SAMN04488518_1184 [Pseudovibrio ascidiaceicola]|uniref:Tyr recombinase domain-containing protein n=1 Tax=Pseudovibrio ascidiaceicola TaxID=285279 RepID=A0A1I4F8B7_9HYPH|nr:hypothetical protein [Pseudovibrio ascidiaceicola]SFL14222.1 hypothetical protein SAMN04488518_1184 [Pseudovibrio ascidiaceicola]